MKKQKKTLKLGTGKNADKLVEISWTSIPAGTGDGRSVEDFTALIEADPGNAEYYNKRGQAYIVQGDTDKALGDFEQAIRLKPDSLDAYRNRGVVFSMRKDYERALADFNRLIELDPRDPVTYFNRGTVYKAKGELNKAIADYTQAIRIDKKMVEAYYCRGIVYLDIREANKALWDLSQTIKLAPAHAEAYLQRGRAYAQRGENDHAKDDYTRVISLDSGNAKAYTGRAAVYLDEGEIDNAVADVDRALSLNPQLAEAYYSRGLILAQKGEAGPAIEEYNRAIALSPNFTEAYNYRGEAYRSRGDLERALEDYQRAIELDPRYAHGYMNKGLVYAQKGEREQAIAYYTTAIKLNPMLAEAYVYRGDAYMGQEDAEKAILDYKKALGIKKTEGVYVKLCSAYEQTNDFDQGMMKLNEALRLNPGSAGLYVKRAQLYLTIGCHKAIADFTEALKLNPADTEAREGLEWCKRQSPDKKAERIPSADQPPPVDHAPPREPEEHEFEYRRQDENVYWLHVDGKPTAFHIFGMPAGPQGRGPARILWFADGGPDKKIVRQYPSLEAAFREERELLEDLYQTSPLTIRGIPAGIASAPAPAPVSFYPIGPYFGRILETICNTLGNHGKPGQRIHLESPNALPYWFKVIKEPPKTGAGYTLGVEGAIHGCRFKFRREGGEFSFSAETPDDAEHIFYWFLFMMDAYQKSEGLGALELVRYFCTISEADSPPVSANNYAVFTGTAIKPLYECLETISRNSFIYDGLVGRYGIIVYSENTRIKDMEPEYIPVSKKFLDDFKSLYFLDNAILLCVRKNGEQHIYFYVPNGGLFYNTKDASRTFLVKENLKLAGSLSTIPKLVNAKNK
jgi:tetratricopeptide (TPR) repeat protein